jgi:Tfp pilus assembly protein PilF
VDPLDIGYAVQLNYNLGACYLKKGNMPEAQKWIEKALTIDPNDATSLLGLGVVYFSQGNKQKAKSLFLKAKKSCSEREKELKADIDYWLKKVD